jgi:hypothetical protein
VVAILFRVFARFRSRRQRWVAPLLALLLLFNQTALSTHLCSYVGGGNPSITLGTADSMPCHAQHAKSPLPTATQLACQMHCGDQQKLGKDPVVLSVPMLEAAILPALAITAPEKHPDVFPSIDIQSPPGRRRLDEFCVRLI